MVNPSAVFDALSVGRRRLALYCLEDAGEALSVGWLADRVLAREERVTVDRVGSERARRVAVALHHNHLPKLADADLVAYDPEADSVTPVEHPVDVAQVVSTARAMDSV